MKKRLLALLLCMTVVVGLFAGCQKTNTAGQEEVNKDYVVKVVSEAGKLLANVDVEVSANGEVVDSGKTNEEGIFNFTMETPAEYTVKLSGLGGVYVVEESYTFTENTAEIIIDSILDETKLGAKTYKTGDVMFDLVVTSTDGVIYSVADLLAEKELVVINFWATWCGYCQEEMPFINEAYQMNIDKVEVLALSPDSGDTNEVIADFKSRNGLSFPMGQVGGKVYNVFGKGGAVPVTVYIDREGIIRRVHVGALPDTGAFLRFFEPYLGDNFEPLN